MKKIITLIFFVPFISIAQQDLPVGFSNEELQQMELMKFEPVVSTNQYGIKTPPSSPVRTMAEWEESQAVAITWTSYSSMLKDIVKAAQTECTVYIVCSGTSGSDSTSIKNYLTSNSVPLTNLHFKIAPYNSVWIRDYGPNPAYTNDVDSLIFVDWIYNRPSRPKDDTVPSVIARDLKIPIYITSQSPYDIIGTGGNWMSDGLGTAFGSNLTIQENPNHSTAAIDQIMHDFMGINRYIHMTVLPYDGIHHIDMHMTVRRLKRTSSMFFPIILLFSERLTKSSASRSRQTSQAITLTIMEIISLMQMLLSSTRQ